MKINKKSINVDKLQFRFELFEDDVVVQTLPGFGELEIDLTTDYSENWYV